MRVCHHVEENADNAEAADERRLFIPYYQCLTSVRKIKSVFIRGFCVVCVPFLIHSHGTELYALLLNLFSNLAKIGTHPRSVFVVDDIQQLVQFGADTFYLCRGAGIE